MLAPNIIAGITAVGAAVLVGLIGVQTVRLSWEQKAHAETVTKHSKQIEKLTKQALEAEREARKEGERRVTAIRESANEAQKQLEAAYANLDSAADAGRRLREQYNRLSARRCPSPVSPPAVAGSAPADPTSDLLADVRRRLEEAENETIGFADKSRIAGLTCERDYQIIQRGTEP